MHWHSSNFFIMAESLCDLIVDETNRYGTSKANWLNIDRDDVLGNHDGYKETS